MCLSESKDSDAPCAQWDVISGKEGYKLKNVASGTYLGHPTNQPLAMDVTLVGGAEEGEWIVKKANECYV